MTGQVVSPMGYHGCFANVTTFYTEIWVKKGKAAINRRRLLGERRLVEVPSLPRKQRECNW